MLLKALGASLCRYGCYEQINCGLVAHDLSGFILTQEVGNETDRIITEDPENAI